MKNKIIYSNLVVNLIILIIVSILLINIITTGSDPNNRMGAHIGTIALSLIPILLIIFQKKRLNPLILTYYTLYIFIASFLGTSLNFYNNYENINFDKIVHAFMGYTLAFLGLYILKKTNSLDKLSLLMIILFIFVFANALGAFWELLEFAGDNLLGQTAQGLRQTTVDGNIVIDVGETMFDMIANLTGSIIFILHFYIYKKINNKGLMHFMVENL